MATISPVIKHNIFLYFDICNYICLDTSYHCLALSLLLKYSLFFFKYSCTNIFHRHSLCTFYNDRGHSSLHLLWMLEWPLSGQCMLTLITFLGTSNWWLKKILNANISNLININWTHFIQVLNHRGYLYRFWLCPSNDILHIYEKMVLRLGLHAETGRLKE